MPNRRLSTHHQQIGRVGGLRRAALGTNETGRKQAAQAARMARYDAQIPPEVTDPVERARRRDLLIRADMANLARRRWATQQAGTPKRPPASRSPLADGTAETARNAVPAPATPALPPAGRRRSNPHQPPAAAAVAAGHLDRSVPVEAGVTPQPGVSQGTGVAALPPAARAHGTHHNAGRT